MKIAELFEAKDERAIENAKRVFGDKAVVKGSKIIVKMSQAEYDKKLLQYLTDLDDGREWGANYKGDAAVFEPEY